MPRIINGDGPPINDADRSSSSESSTASVVAEPLSSISQDVSVPMRQSPTAQRLGEILSAWLPDSREGIYHQYLQSLSPGYDHLLTHSRYDRLWRFSHLLPHETRFSSQTSSLSSPVHVIENNNHRAPVHHTFDGTNFESMEDFKSKITSQDRNPAYGSSCVVGAQHLTCLSMEALGSGLSLDPNVLSHHIGSAFKAIEQDTSLHRLENSETRVNSIPTSVGVYERDRNLQILRNHLGRLQFANVEHARDLTVRDCILKSPYNRYELAVTVSVDIPRTIYVQGYQSDEHRTNPVPRRFDTMALGLQDAVLNRRSARQRFGDDSMLCDQGERYWQNGLDVLQHVTINVTRSSCHLGHEQVLVLFPPYPELDKDNDPCIFLDPLRKKEITTSFAIFCVVNNVDGHRPRAQLATDTQTRGYDVEVFARDMFGLPYNATTGAGRAEQALDLVRSYAINAWFDRLQSLENQLQDFYIDLSQPLSQNAESSQQERGASDDKLLNENGMVNAIHRYIASLDLECHRLRIDIRSAEETSSDQHACERLTQMMEKYSFIRSRMACLLTQTQHLLGMKATEIQDPLPSYDSRWSDVS